MNTRTSRSARTNTAAAVAPSKAETPGRGREVDPFARTHDAANRPANDTRRTRSSASGEKRGAARRLRFHLMGYLFTYCPDERQARVRIDMWRENPRTGERHWITVAATAPERKAARRVALALVAWVRSCGVETRVDPRAQAVAESFAMLRERLAMLDPHATGSVRARAVCETREPATTVERAATAHDTVVEAPVTRPGSAGETRAAAA